MTRASDTRRRSEDRTGEVIRGRFFLERLIGTGGMASVYEARHRNRSRVAIKVLHSHLGLSPEQLRRFQREGYAVNRIGHPGVVRIHDDDVTADGCACLVMELLEGGTVAARARSNGGRLPGDEVVRLGIRLLEILEAAHRVGVLHRDIKPDNLFLTADGVLKVLDFGIARFQDDSLEPCETQAGTLLGTPAFASPEQARGAVHAIDERSDLWAVGATLFTLMTGRFVHPATTGNEQLALTMTQPPVPIRRIDPGVPPVIASVIDRALAFDPDRRWPDAASMRQALEDGVSGARRSVARAPAQEPASSPGADTESDEAAPSTRTTEHGEGDDSSDARRGGFGRYAGTGATLLALAGLVTVVSPPGGRGARKDDRLPVPAVVGQPKRLDTGIVPTAFVPTPASAPRPPAGAPSLTVGAAWPAVSQPEAAPARSFHRHKPERTTSAKPGERDPAPATSTDADGRPSAHVDPVGGESPASPLPEPVEDPFDKRH